MPDREKEVVTLNGLEIERYTDDHAATMKGVRDFFGPPTISAQEIMRLKKDKATGADLPDWGHLAKGIGTGTLTY